MIVISSLKKQNSRRLSDCDYFAIILGFGITIYYVISVRYGIQSIDESCYFAITHRMALGDRLILDEWHMAQLIALIQYLPYKIFYSIVGSNDGVCLYFRYVYVIIKIILFFYIYSSLRRYPWWNLLTAFIFTGYDSFSFTTINYYCLAYYAICVIGIILFIKKKTSVIDYIITGIILSFGVISNVGVAFVYFAYSALVIIFLILKKTKKPILDRYDFILNLKTWLWISISIMISACLVLTILFAGKDIKDIISALSQIPKDSEYNYVTGTAKVFKIYKFIRFISPTGFALTSMPLSLAMSVVLGIIGTVSFILGYTVIIILVILNNSGKLRRRSQSENDENSKRINKIRLFISAFIVFIVTEVIMLICGSTNPSYNGAMNAFKPVYLTMLVIVTHLLTDKKEKYLTAFLILVLFSSFGLDFTSEVSMGNMMIAACVPGILIIRNFLIEITGNEHFSFNSLLISFKTGKRSFRRHHQKSEHAKTDSLICILLLLLIGCEIYYYSFVRTWQTEKYHDYWYDHPIEASTQVTLDKGPLKDLITNEFIKNRYDEAISDLDMIKKMPGDRIYVADLCCWYYLYTDKPYSIYSTYYVEADSRTRTLDWWKLHPDKLPGIIYVPYFDWDHGEYTPDKAKAMDKVEWLDTFADFDLTEGKAGYILDIKFFDPALADTSVDK